MLFNPHLPQYCQHGQNLKQLGFSLGTIRFHAAHVEKLLTIDREYNEPFTADRYCPEFSSGAGQTCEVGRAGAVECLPGKHTKGYCVSEQWHAVSPGRFCLSANLRSVCPGEAMLW